MKEVSSSSDDDGFATLPRNPLLNPIHLGQIADFWKRYDYLADTHDLKLSKQLSENLDVLLIFAGLFSAINTAFISFTMPALSPSPSAETNALLRLLISGADNDTLAAFDKQSEPFTPQPISIAMNCLLYASLSCSSVAAIGAMMCKEWLHSFDRSVQTGSIEDQGRLRQRKLDGARRWHLETIIDFLPTIILLSITLFFAGVALFLLTLNKTVAAFEIAFGAFCAVGGTGTILAGAIFPLCPYETAASRLIRKVGLMVVAWRPRLRITSPAAAGQRMVKVALESLLSLYSRSKEALRRAIFATEHEGTLPMQNQPTRPSASGNTYPEMVKREAEKRYKQHVTNSRAALWLLEMAPSREDQLLAVRFFYTAPREACAAAIMSSEQLQLIISFTLESFDNWRSQPNEKTQEMVEHFGRALWHVLPQAREGIERWKELTAPTQNPRLGLGERFVQELDSLEQIPHPSDAMGEEYALQSALLRTLIFTKDIPVEAYRWTSLKFLIGNNDPNSQLLGLWAKLVHKAFGHSHKFHLRRFTSTNVAVLRKGRPSVKRDGAETDFPLALACGVQTLKSVERQAAPDQVASMVLDAVEIYTACVHKTRQIAEAKRLLPAFQELVVDSMTEMMTYFSKSTFLNPPEQQLIDFIVSALLLIRSFCGPGYAPSLDDAAFDGLWYALESIISVIDSCSEVDRGSRDDIVLQTLESISEWLPPNFGIYSPMVGMENHPQIIGYITWHLAREVQSCEGRVMHLVYKNRFRWFTQASSTLRTAWMDAGLSSQLVDALRRPGAWKDTALVVQILEDITEMSGDWCRRLVADEFLVSVANVILHFDQAVDANTFKRSYIQCRLTRAFLSVWRNCSTMPGIKWPEEKMILVIESARAATERLLGRDWTQISPAAAPNVALTRDVVLNTCNSLQPFLDWTNEHLLKSTLTNEETTHALSTLLSQRTDKELPPISRFQVSRTCSRNSYIECGLL